MTKADRLTKDAIKLIQSVSMREWASSAHNLPIITQMAALAIKNNGGKADPTAFSTYLTLAALG